MDIFHGNVSLAEATVQWTGFLGRALLAARETRDPAKEAKVLRQIFRVHFDRGDLQVPRCGELGVGDWGAPGRENKDEHPTKCAHTISAVRFTTPLIGVISYNC